VQEWFHPNTDLKRELQKYVGRGGYFSKSKQHCPILASYPFLK
jgi:hypothetical protein